jgi:hypothetical protein
MAFAFHILGTSSSGNCSILEAGGTRIMLDAGFQGPRLEASLAKLGLPAPPWTPSSSPTNIPTTASGLRPSFVKTPR